MIYYYFFLCWIESCKYIRKNERILKAYDTRSSQAVPHPSTILARRCLTSVIGRERVFSSWYGRRHKNGYSSWLYNLIYILFYSQTDCPLNIGVLCYVYGGAICTNVRVITHNSEMFFKRFVVLKKTVLCVQAGKQFTSFGWLLCSSWGEGQRWCWARLHR